MVSWPMSALSCLAKALLLMNSTKEPGSLAVHEHSVFVPSFDHHLELGVGQSRIRSCRHVRNCEVAFRF